MKKDTSRRRELLRSIVLICGILLLMSLLYSVQP